MKVDPEFVGSAWYYFSIAVMWAAAALNLVLCFRSIRSIRWNHEMREVMWAYNKELLERGVTLPPRCANCCQILPRHVDGCDFGNFYRALDKFYEFISRPPIKWYPKGEKPPELGGKRG